MTPLLMPLMVFLRIVEILSENGPYLALLYGSKGLDSFVSKLDRNEPDYSFVTEFDGNEPSFLTACPAYTPREVEFNKNASISTRSLFARKFYKGYNGARNLKLNVCEKPILPVVLYNAETGHYEIGYELYYEDNKIELIQRPHTKFDNYSHALFYGMAYPSKDLSDSIYKFEDNGRTKFSFNGEIKPLVFHWIRVWSVFITNGITRQIYFEDWSTAIDEKYNDAKISSDNYYPYLKKNLINDVFLKENQRRSLSNFSIPPSLLHQDDNYFVKYPVIPLWYTSKHAHKFSYHSSMNFVPIWKTIAEGMLKKIDILVFLLINAVRNEWEFDRCSGNIEIDEIIFGVSKALQFNKTDSEQRGDLFLSDEKQFYKIAVPRVIYKIIRLKSFDMRSAVIIIHNNPTPISNSDRICSKESELSGWKEFTNEDPKTGLTYVCPFTPEVIRRLKVYCIYYYDQPLFLEPYLPAETKKINEDFEILSYLLSENETRYFPEN